MNNQNFETKAFEKSAIKSLNDSAKTFELLIGKTSELLEKNVTAAKSSLERHANYAKSLKEVSGVEDFAKLQESITKAESEAVEEFSREIYQISSEASAKLAKVGEENRNKAVELANEAFDNVSSAIANGAPQPYGSFIKEGLRMQADATKVFGGFFEKAMSLHQDNLKSLSQVMGASVKTNGHANGNKPSRAKKGK